MGTRPSSGPPSWAGAPRSSAPVGRRRLRLPVLVSAPDGSPDGNPFIAPDGEGGLLVVWEGWVDGRAQVFRSRLVSGEWTAEERVDPRPESDQIFPRARETGFGRTEISWREDGENVTAEDGKTVRGTADSGPTKALSGAPYPNGAAWLLCENGDGSGSAYRYRDLLSPLPEDKTTEVPLRGSASEHYIGYGDSITYGHDSGSDTGGWYGSLLAAMLPSLYPGLNFYFYNEGYPGAETHDLLLGGGAWGCPGINTVIDNHPDATKILIMGGTNDVDHGIPPPTIQFNLSEMVDRARAKGVAPLLGTIIPSNKDTPAFLGSWQLSTYYIPPLADAKGCPLANPYERYMYYYQLPDPYHAAYWNLYLGDGIHPAWPQGDQEIANAWFPASAPPPPPGPPPPP